MDRTIEESQQLDVLFEQMLAARTQGQTASPNLNPGSSSAALGLPPPLMLPIQTVDDDVSDLALGFADDCFEFCHEAQQQWTGTASALLAHFVVSYTNCSRYFNSCVLQFADIYSSAIKRFPCDCAICMLPVGAPLPPSTARDAENEHDALSKHRHFHSSRREIILSCSHVFHAKCIGNFERFLLATVSVHHLLYHTVVIIIHSVVNHSLPSRKPECARCVEASTPKSCSEFLKCNLF